MLIIKGKLTICYLNENGHITYFKVVMTCLNVAS